MLITPIKLYSINNNQNKYPKTYTVLSSVKTDTVVFGLKRNDFEGIDKFVLIQLKINPQRYKLNKEFQEDCQKKADYIWQQEYPGNINEVTLQRKVLLNQWREYLHNENKEYKSSGEWLIAKEITSFLEKNNHDIPPILDKRVLADTMEYIQNNADKANEISFYKEYQRRLRLSMIDALRDEDSINNIPDGWIFIPSKSNDPENFQKNVEKLKTLSNSTWCTKSFMADKYLEKGDFHIYYQKGKPRIGVRFEDNILVEVQGEKNNSKIPIKYEDTVKKYIKDNQFIISPNVEKSFANTDKLREKFNDILQNKLHGKNPKNCSAEEILTACGIEIEQDKTDGLYTISHFSQPDEEFTFEELGADMKKIEAFLGKTKRILGNADFEKTKITDLSNLRYIGKSADFRWARICDLLQLEYIGENANFFESSIKNLPKLKKIGRNANFESSLIKDLSSLESVGENANFKYVSIKDLSKLKFIRGCALFSHAKIEDMSNLEMIGGKAEFDYAFVNDISNLHTISGGASFTYSFIKGLPSLSAIGASADFSNSQVTDLSNLKRIGCSAKFSNSCITDLSSLITIGNDADFSNSQVTDLSGLQSIGGYASFANSKIVKLISLESIGESANFLHSQKIILPLLRKCPRGIYNGERIQNKKELISRGIAFNSLEIYDPASEYLMYN